MNDGFKQRLVGAVVLISVALILWPVIFTDTSTPGLDRSSEIPATPSFDKYVVAEPDRVAGLDPIAKPQPLVEESAPEPLSRPEPESQTQTIPKVDNEPRQDANGLPVAWSLQVASFSQQENAEELKLALQKLGHKAYTRSITTKEGKSTRVYIGPRFSKDAFDQDRKDIDQRFKVNSIAVRFEP